MIILSLAVFPISLLSRNNENRRLILRQFLQTYRKDTTYWQTEFENKINQIELKVDENQAILERTRDALIYFALGDRRPNQNETRKAIEAYKKAGSLLPNNP